MLELSEGLEGTSATEGEAEGLTRDDFARFSRGALVMQFILSTAITTYDFAINGALLDFCLLASSGVVPSAVVGNHTALE